MPTIAQDLARFIRELEFEALPEVVIEATRTLVRDQLSVQLAGSTMPWVSPALRLTEMGVGSKAESSVVNCSRKYLAADAAFVNATYAQACEYDDSTFGAAGHIGTATIPVAVALGERNRIDGRSFITAVAAGYEVMYRLMAAIRPHHNTRGFHSQGIGGPFAGAAAASKILGLSEEQTTHALSIAGSYSSGPLEFDQSGGEVKRLHAGFAARAGVNAALLAQFGLTGPVSIIEGERGFCRLFSTQFDLSKIVVGLGSTFNITNAWLKVYPATGPVHTAIRATERLSEQLNLTSGMIERIEIDVAETSLMHGGGIRRPHDVLGAQFSFAYSIALQICRKNNYLSSYVDERLWVDEEMDALMQKINLRVDATAREKYHHKATVRVLLKDGRRAEAIEEFPLGTPANPAGAERLRAKASALSQMVLSADQSDRLICAIENLEGIADIAAIADMLRASSDGCSTATTQTRAGTPNATIEF